MMRQLRDTFADMSQHSAPNLFYGSSDRKTKRMSIGGTMAFYDNPPQPQQTGAIVAPVINAPLERLDYRNCDKPSKFRQEIAPEFLPEKSGQHLCDPFRGF